MTDPLVTFAQAPGTFDERVAALVAAVGLGHVAIHRLILPAVAYLPGGTGASRLGGVPDVPAGFAWPTHDGRPLRFLAQLDLAEAAGTVPELPAEGSLAFFYDADEQPWGEGEPSDEWRVYHFPDRAALAPMAGAEAFPAVPLRGVPIATLGGTWSSAWDELDEQTDDEYQRLEALDDGFIERQLGGERPLAQLGGFTLMLQDGDLNEGSDLDAQRDPEAHRLLFQLRSHEPAGMFWGDNGYLYWICSLAQLRARDYGAVFGFLNCY